MLSVDSMTSEWDVLVCVFAVFSHTVQLLGVIGSIHIEPSVVFHRCRIGHKMKSDNGLAFPLKNLGDSTGRVSFFPESESAHTSFPADIAASSKAAVNNLILFIFL